MYTQNASDEDIERMQRDKCKAVELPSAMWFLVDKSGVIGLDDVR
jgi:hypothetical protein